MADENAITSIGYQSVPGSKQAVEEFQQGGQKAIATDAVVGKSAEDRAGKVEISSRRQAAAHKALSAITAEEAAKQKAAAAALDSVILNTVNRPVQDQARTDRFLASMARAADPLGAALRKVQGEVSRLSGIIASGIDGEEKAAQATLSLAAAKLRLADAQRAASVAAASGERGFGGQNELTKSIREYRDQLEPILPLQRAFYENIARINAAASVPGGISQTQRADLIKAATDEYTRQVRIVTGLTEREREAAAAQNELAMSAQRYRDQINPTMPVIRAYSQALAEIEKLKTTGNLRPEEADLAVRNASDDFNKKMSAASGKDAAQGILDQLDATIPVMREYEAELNKISDLQEKGLLTTLQAADANAILSTSFDKLLQKANGFDIAEKFRDQQDPTRAVARTRTETLTQISKAVAAPGGLTSVEESAAINAANDEYEKQIKIVTGVKKAEDDAAAAAAAYQKQLISLKNALDPLATLHKRYAEEIDFANHAAKSGELDERQLAAAHNLAATNLANNIEKLKEHSTATARGAVSAQQMHFALQQLTFQANDVATSLASGISPARTFAQQFGQVLQAFQIAGGPSNAIKAIETGITKLATPLNLAAAGGIALAAGLGLVLSKAIELEGQARQTSVTLRGMGTSGLASAKDFEESIKQLRDFGIAADDARDAAQKVIRTAGLNPSTASTVSIAEAGANLGAIRGSGTAAGVDEIVGALKDGPEALIKLGTELRKLAPQEVEEIRRQKDIAGSVVASDHAYQLISGRIGGAYKDNLSQATIAWINLKNSYNDFITSSAGGIAIKGILDDLGKIPEGIKRDIQDIERIIALVQTGLSAIGYIKNKIVGGIGSVTSAGDKATATATAARNDMTSALAQRDRDAGGTGLVRGAERFDTSKISGNTEALQELTTVLGEASKSLPEGYSLTATSGLRNGKGGSLHNIGEAIDVQIVDSSGHALPNKGPIGSDPGLYKDLAVAAYEANRRLYPGASLTWGGRFETSVGSGMADWMHFDRGQDRGRFGPPLAALSSTTTSASAADATRSVPAAGTSAFALIDQTEKLDKQTREYAKANDAARKFADSQVYAEAKLRGVAEAEALGLVGTQALTFAENAARQAVEQRNIERDKTSKVQDEENNSLLKAAKAFNDSEAAGYRVIAEEQARIEVMQRGGDVTNRTRQILEDQAGSAIRAGAQQTAAALPQLAALEKLAAATLKGSEAAHEQGLQNEAALRTQDALAKAEASRNPGLIAQAKALTDATLSEGRRADAARESIAAAEAANENKLTLARTQLQTTLTPTGITSEEIQRQVDYLTIAQNLATKYATASDETRKAYVDTAIAIADANVALEKAQREQQRWNDMVSSLANTVDSELTKSIEDLFSETKVDKWGTRLQKWIGTATSQLSSSLFVKPALGTVAGVLGFGTAAQSLGSFDNLLGSSTTGSTSGTSGGISVEKSNDGTVTIKGLEATTSLTNSLLGTNSGGIFSNLGTSSNTVTSSNDNIYGTLSGAGSKSLFNSTDTLAADLAGSSTSGTVGSSLSSTGSSLFSLDTLKGVGAGFGAGSVLNSLIGGNKTTGTVGSGVGSLAGAALGSIFPGVGTTIGGIAGGLLGGLSGLFGTTSKPSNSTGVSIDLSSGKTSGYSSSGSATNDKTLKEVSDALTKFTTSVQSSTGGTTAGYINPQATDKGLKLDYNIPGFGAGTYNTTDSQEAIDNAELAITKGLTGVSALTRLVIDKYSGNIDDLKTALDAASTYKDTEVTGTVSAVISKTTDPSKLADALKFADTYDRIDEAAKDAFSSIPADLKTEGPFAKAKDDIKTTFDDITTSAKEFGLNIQPVTDALDEANKRLKDDFNRNIKDLLKAAEDPLQSLVDIEKRAGDARVKEAEAVAGDVEAVNKLNAKNLDKIWTDQTKSIQDLRDEFKTGDLSGLTDYQRLPAARTKYVDTLAAVQGGDTSKWDTLITDAKNLFTLSKSAYGEGPKTAEWRTAITAVLDNVLAGRTFAGGTKSTPPGTVLVGEKGPELISQSGGLHVYTHHETQKILAAMPETHGHAVSQEDQLTKTPKIISLAGVREAMAATGSFASGVKATPMGTILVGEKGPELIATPGVMQAHVPPAAAATATLMAAASSNVVSLAANRGFWQGTSGQYDLMMPKTDTNIVSMPTIMGFADGTSEQGTGLIAPPTFTASFSRGAETPNNSNNEEVKKLLKDVVAAVNINNNISRIGHYETGQELRTQTNELKKTAPYVPSRRRVAS